MTGVGSTAVATVSPIVVNDVVVNAAMAMDDTAAS